jgi:hypothetical protein
MKKNSLLVVLLILIKLFISTTHVFGQTEVTNKWYVTTVDLTVSSYDTLNKDALRTYRVRPGTKFTVINVSPNNNYEIIFGYYGKKSGAVNNERNQLESLIAEPPVQNKIQSIGALKKADITTYSTDSAFISAWANYKTFYISPKDLSNKCLVYYTKDVDFTYGALTLPLKIRFGDGKNIYSQYEENLNLGLTFGLKFTVPSTKEQSINALVLAGVTTVTLDSVNLKTPSYYDPKNTSTKAVTFGLGAVYQYSNFQIGIFTGIDHISGQLGREWRQQDRPWLGIGIGLALFNNTSTTKGSTPTNTATP